MNFSKLKAIVYTKYRDPEVLRIREIEKPYPKDDEVLVKIHAVSINDWDFVLLHGDFINRLLNGLQKPKRRPPSLTRPPRGRSQLLAAKSASRR